MTDGHCMYWNVGLFHCNVAWGHSDFCRRKGRPWSSIGQQLRDDMYLTTGAFSLYFATAAPGEARQGVM